MLIEIVNEGRHDLDVEINLSIFYGKFGRVIITEGNTKKVGDLVVIMRTSNLRVILSAGRVFHIFDYSKTISDIDSCANRNCIVVTLDHKLRTVLEARGIPVIYSYHPVDVEFWTTPRDLQRTHRDFCVHVGNRKVLERNDRQQKAFYFFLRLHNVVCYGANWAGSPLNYGPVSLLAVSRIYRRYSFALGIMYSYQRHVTLSGRLWHAPLNGCQVYTEALPSLLTLPGVKIIDYRIHKFPDQGMVNAGNIQFQAIAYWRQQGVELAQKLSLGKEDRYRPDLYRLYYLAVLIVKDIKMKIKKFLK